MMKWSIIRMFSYVISYILFSLSMLLSVVTEANAKSVVVVEDLGEQDYKEVSVSGVFIQTQAQKVLKVGDDSYLLIDKDNVLKTAKGYRPNSMIQSFRVCVHGELISNRNQYDKLGERYTKMGHHYVRNQSTLTLYVRSMCPYSGI